MIYPWNVLLYPEEFSPVLNENSYWKTFQNSQNFNACACTSDVFTNNGKFYNLILTYSLLNLKRVFILAKFNVNIFISDFRDVIVS